MPIAFTSSQVFPFLSRRGGGVRVWVYRGTTKEQMSMFFPPTDVEVRRCPAFRNERVLKQCYGKTEGSGEVYAYMPECKRNTEVLLAVPGSHDNHPYGISVGRGAFVFPPGQWVTVAERVKLNDPGEENGN